MNFQRSHFNDFSFLLDISMKINLHILVLFYCLPYNTLYHLRDWSYGIERFALSECIMLLNRIIGVCASETDCS